MRPASVDAYIIRARDPNYAPRLAMESSLTMEDLLCPDCKNPFSLNLRVPKTLHCLHTFCLKCLKLKHTDEGKPFVFCPAPSWGARHDLDDQQGQQDIQNGLKTDYFIERASSCYQMLSSPDPRCGKCTAPDNQAKGYCERCRVLLCQVCSDYHKRVTDPKDHIVKDLQEVLQVAQTARGKLDHFTNKKRWKCEGHRGEPEETVEEASFYCLKCEKMICITCATCDHSEHKRTTAPRLLAGQDEQFNIRPHLEELWHIAADYDRALHSIDDEIEHFEKECRLASEHVEIITQNLQEGLFAEQEALLRKVNHIHDARVEEIHGKLKEFEDERREMSHSIEFAKNTLLCIPEDILEQEDALVERLGQLCQKYELHPLEPLQRDVFVRSLDPDLSLNGAVGQVYTNPDLNSLAEGFERVPFRQGKKTEFQLTCRDSMGTPLPATDFEVALTEVRPDARMFPVRKNPNGTFTGALEPRSSGEHSVHLEVQYTKGGGVVQLAPFTVFVSPTLPEEARVEKTISREDLREMVRPAGIALSRQYIAVADKEAHKIFILALDGQCVNVIGDQGEDEGEFNSPRGVDWWGENVVVADTGNHRVQFLSVEGVFFKAIGGYGGHCMQFIEPRDVAVSVSEDSATIFVADAVNCRVQFFRMADATADAQPLGVYTIPNMPLSLCVGNRDRVFVTENLANQFKILSLKCHERQLEASEPQPMQTPELALFNVCTNKENAEAQLNRVRGLTYDPQTRYVLVTEEGNPKICVFDRDGGYVGTVKLPGKKTMQLVDISALDSRVVLVAYKGEKYAISVLNIM